MKTARYAAVSVVAVELFYSHVGVHRRRMLPVMAAVVNGRRMLLPFTLNVTALREHRAATSYRASRWRRSRDVNGERRICTHCHGTEGNTTTSGRLHYDDVEHSRYYHIHDNAVTSVRFTITAWFTAVYYYTGEQSGGWQSMMNADITTC